MFERVEVSTENVTFTLPWVSSGSKVVDAVTALPSASFRGSPVSASIRVPVTVYSRPVARLL